MRYICLLRGINVGGNHRVEMSRLKEVFENTGFTNIVTYINSGNIVFESKVKPNVNTLNKALEGEFGFKIPTLVIDENTVKAVADAIPPNWTNDTEQKSDVVYLFSDVDSPDVIKQLNYRPEYETILYVPGALLCNVLRKYQTRSSLLKVVGTPLYWSMTIRNVNTARKLAQLVS